MTESAITMTPGHDYSWFPPGRPDDAIIDAPGATKIISGGVPKFLTAWAAKMAAECAVLRQSEWAHLPDDEAIAHIKKASDRHRDHAADVGTRAHAWCEARAVAEIDPPDAADIQGHAFQFEKFLTERRPTYTETEVTVFSREHHYSGTLDGIADIPGLGRTLLDIKTGARVYPEVCLQLAAYARADFIGRPDGTEDPIPEFDAFAVLHLRPKSYRLIPVTVTDTEFYDFLYAKQVRSFLARGRRLIGDPLPAPGVAA